MTETRCQKGTTSKRFITQTVEPIRQIRKKANNCALALIGHWIFECMFLFSLMKIDWKTSYKIYQQIKDPWPICKQKSWTDAVSMKWLIRAHKLWTNQLFIIVPERGFMYIFWLDCLLVIKQLKTFKFIGKIHLFSLHMTIFQSF